MKRTPDLEKILYKALQEAEPCLRETLQTLSGQAKFDQYLSVNQHVRNAMSLYEQQHSIVKDTLAEKIKAAVRNEVPAIRRVYRPQDQLTIGSVAKLARVGRGTAQNWINKGFLKSYKLPSGHTRIAARDLMKFFEAQNMPIPNELDNSEN